MSDEKITELNQKQGKNPKESAISKLREEALKEAQNKVNEATKKAFQADKIARTEKEALNQALENLEEVKAEFISFAESL